MCSRRGVLALHVAFCCGLLGGACSEAPAPAAHPLFEEVSALAGTALTLVSGGDLAVKETILEVNGNGVALLDVDGDGDLDLALIDGSTRTTLLAGALVHHHLLRNDGVRDGVPRFTPWEQHGLVMAGWPTGVAVADVDGDGRPDLVVGGLGEDALFLNRTGADGEARFEKLLLPGRSSARDWTASLALADADGDGHLDLYLARYLDIDPADPPLGKVEDLPCRYAGQDVMCGPHGLPTQPDVFLRGRDGPPWFEQAAATWGVTDAAPAFGLGVVFADLDGDGRPDLYVANDSVDNFVLANRDGERFEHVGRASGAASDMAGRPQAGMGVAVGDVDGDRDLDLAVTNFSDEANALYRNDGGLLFRETSTAAGTGHVSRPLLGWGVHLADFDGDGVLDLFVANGHVYPEADAPGTGTSYAQPLLFQAGLGGGRFAAPQTVLERSVVARGSAAGDLDGDGDLDLVVLQLDGPPLLLLNGTDDPGRQLLVTLEDAPDPLGALLSLRVDGAWRSAVRLSSSGFQSASDQRLHIGGGASGGIGRALVRWPGGEEEILDPSSLAFGRQHVVRRGLGVVSSSPLGSGP
jgi:hypothetical protein